MKRRAVNLLCLLSLLVFAGSATIWVRSYRARDTFEQKRSDAASNMWTNSFGWNRGDLFFIRISGDGREAPSGPAVRSQWRHYAWPPAEGQRWTRREAQRFIGWGGVQFAQVRPVVMASPMWIQQLIIPLWLFLPAAIPPLLWRRRRRQRHGRGFAVELSAPDGSTENLPDAPFSAPGARGDNPLP